MKIHSYFMAQPSSFKSKSWSRVGLTVWSPHEATPDKVKETLPARQLLPIPWTKESVELYGVEGNLLNGYEGRSLFPIFFVHNSSIESA